MDCICDALQQRNDVGRLAEFLRSLPEGEREKQREALLRARASVSFHEGDYSGLYSILTWSRVQTQPITHNYRYTHLPLAGFLSISEYLIFI